MKRAEGGRNRGYTILETMIFLAVSAAMFVSATALISGKQSKTEFSSAIRDLESSLHDIANDVSNGYYANATSNGQTFYCHATGTTITINTVSSTVQGCIFIGKAIQFAPDSNKSQYSVINLVGRQHVGGLASNGDVESFGESSVVAVSKAVSAPYSSVPEASASTRIGGGVTVECVFYSENPSFTPPASTPCSSGVNKIDTVVYMTTFNASDSFGSEEVGSSQVDLLVPRVGGSPNAAFDVGRTKAAAAESLNTYLPDANTASPIGGVYACMQSNGTNQYALVALGGKSSQQSASTTVVSGRCS